MTVGEIVEFDVPAPDRKTVRKLGKLLELLPNGRMRVEITVGGDTTTMLIDPNRQQKSPKPKLETKKKEPSLDLFGSAMQKMREQIAELTSLVSPPPPEIKAIPTDDDITNDTVVKADFYDPDFLGKPRQDVLILHRVHVPGHGRLYAVKYRQADGSWGPTEFYTGVTTICDKVMGASEDIVEWAVNKFASADEYHEWMNEMANLGSFLHGLMAKCAMGLLPNIDDPAFDQMVRAAISRYGYNIADHFREWSSRAKKELLSFKKWVWDRNVIFHAIEIPIGIPHSKDANGNKVFGWFNQLDFFVTMDAEDYPDKPKPKRIPLPDKAGTPATAPEKLPRSWKKINEGEVYEAWILPSRSQGDSWAAGDTNRFQGPANIPDSTFVVFEATAGEPREINVRRQVERIQTYVPWDCPQDVVRERIIAITDYKSGKNSSPSHALQLQLQKLTLEYNFPHLDFSKLRLFNLHTSDWQEHRDNPTYGYSLKEKTSEYFKSATAYLNIWRNEHARELPRKAVYLGEANVTTHPRENTMLVDYKDYFDERFERSVKNGFITLNDL
jgi:hypothetical protein